FACPGRLAFLKGEGRVRDNFRPIGHFGANPHLNPLPFCKGRAGRSSADLKLTINEHYHSNFPQTLPVRFFHLKASQHELLDPSAARLGLPSVENQPARDWLAKSLCRAL